MSAPSAHDSSPLKPPPHTSISVTRKTGWDFQAAVVGPTSPSHACQSSWRLGFTPILPSHTALCVVSIRQFAAVTQPMFTAWE